MLTIVFCLPQFSWGQQSYQALQTAYNTEARPLQYFSDLAELESQNAWVWHFLGKSQHEARFDSQSLVSFRTACSLAPKEAFHWQELAGASERNGDLDDALKHWRKAKSLESRQEARTWIESRIVAGEKKRATISAARSRINISFYLALALCAALSVGVILMTKNKGRA